MNNTITLPKETMQDILWNENDKVISDVIIETGRWTVNHELIFKHEGKLWRTSYQVGATEQQDERPWEYDDQVACIEVVATQVMTTTYINAGKVE